MLPVLVGVPVIVAFVVSILLVIKRRRQSIASLTEIDENLSIYRKIRHVLGIHMLTSYPSLVPSELRMRLLKQLDIYDGITDDESERRWERTWMPKLIDTADSLGVTDIARQDREFMDAIDGFKTNELLIANAKDRRRQLVSNPIVAILNESPEIRDSHILPNIPQGTET